MKRTAAFSLIAAALLLAAPPSRAERSERPSTEPEAIIGVATVFDPKNLAEGVKRLTELRVQVSELRRQIDVMRATQSVALSHWSHYFWQTVPLEGLGRYRVQADPWGRSEATDLVGRTGQWIRGVNQGLGARAGYRKATVELESPGGLIDRLPAGQRERTQIRYAAVELADAAALHAMRTLGGVRRQGRDSRQALEQLESDTFSDGLAQNRQVAVLNKINAATAAALRSGQETNKLLSALLEQRLIEARALRDAQAEEMNRRLAFQREARRIGEQGLRGSAGVLAGFRLP